MRMAVCVVEVAFVVEVVVLLDVLLVDVIVVVVVLVVEVVVAGIVVVAVAVGKIGDEIEVDCSAHGSCSVFTQRHADSSKTWKNLLNSFSLIKQKLFHYETADFRILTNSPYI